MSTYGLVESDWSHDGATGGMSGGVINTCSPKMAVGGSTTP